MLIQYHHLSKRSYEPLNQQCMSLLVTRYPIFSSESVPEIWHLAWNLRVVFGTNDMVSTITGLYILSDYHPNILIYVQKVMKHAISNECLSLQHIVQSPGLRGCLKSGILPSLCNVIFVIVSNDMVWTRRGLCVLSEAPLIIIIHLRRKCVEHTNSKSCLSLQHNTSFPVRRGCLKSNILN